MLPTLRDVPEDRALEKRRDRCACVVNYGRMTSKSRGAGTDPKLCGVQQRAIRDDGSSGNGSSHGTVRARRADGVAELNFRLRTVAIAVDQYVGPNFRLRLGLRRTAVALAEAGQFGQTGYNERNSAE